MRPGDYLKAINHEKKNIFEDDFEQAEKDYHPYIINRCLSYFPDTIMQANEMNFRWETNKKMQFDFLLHSTRKRKRFSKWLKDEKSEDFEIIKKYFDYSNKKTKEIMALLSEDDIKNIKEKMDTGGKK
jgi:mevalonate kinase